MNRIRGVGLLALAIGWVASCSDSDSGSAGGGDDDSGEGAGAGATTGGDGGDSGCVADCTDRCGGADDGCSGSCTDACPEGELCDAEGTCKLTLYDDMLLQADGATLVLPDGEPLAFRGAISCCGGAYGWPLVDDAWIDYVHARDVNFLHVRLGPFLTGPNGEPDWAAIGGGYVEVDGVADLMTFNDAFWARVVELIQRAGELGIWVEVDVADGWAIKRTDLSGYSAWAADGNLQAVDWRTPAGDAAIAAGSVHDQWVRKVVAETGRFGNVVYQDGNEIGLVDGYAPAWTLSIGDIIRDEEESRGYGRHLFGTNSGHSESMQAEGVDYIEFHGATAPDPSQCFGRPCLSNEYNPNPALSPEALVAEVALACSRGTYFWYWRHGQSAVEMDATLDLMADADCEPPTSETGCAFPTGIPEEAYIDTATSNTDTDPAVDAAVNDVMEDLSGCGIGSSCDLSSYAGATTEAKCQSWFDAVNEELRVRGFCAGQHETGSDEIAVSNSGCTGKWYGYHVCFYGGPKVVWNPGARRGWWKIAPESCP